MDFPRAGSIAVCEKEGTKHFTLRNEILEFTDFLPDNSSFSERCFYFKNKISYFVQCACGCGERISKPEKAKYIRGHSNKDELVKQRKKDSCIANFGTDNPSKNKEFILKKEETNLKKFGVKYPAQSASIIQKTKEKWIEKYGVDNPAKLDSIKKKISEGVSVTRDSCKDAIIKSQFITQYNKILTEERMGNIIPLFDANDYAGKDGIYNFQCKKCNNIFLSNLDNGKIPRCFDCFPKIDSGGQSIIEKELIDFIKTLEAKVIENNRIIISPMEIDSVVPDKRIGFELNGLYWHSEVSGNKSKFYHAQKTKLATDADFRLIQIFEDEWNNKKPIVKARIKSILGKQTRRIYARKCAVKEIDSKTKNKFLKKYHIQGEDKSSYCLGLFYKNRLVSVMTFSNLRPALGYSSSLQDEYELVRFCSIFHFNVVGGASKLLKHFEQFKNPKKIISYADARWSQGNLYHKLNFNFVGKTQPNYFYIINQSRKHRYGFQKNKLSKLLKNYDENLSEWENMKNHKFDRIWDCGNLKFIKNFN